MIACLWQALPDKTARQTRDLVIQSSDRYTSPSAQYGYGILILEQLKRFK
jgi:hypothetical protein